MMDIMNKVKCVKCNHMVFDAEDMLCHVKECHPDVFTMIDALKNVDVKNRGEEIIKVIENILDVKILSNMQLGTINDLYALNGKSSVLELAIDVREEIERTYDI